MSSPGFLVPTAAVATIVLTTTGAQMGGSPVAAASTNGSATISASLSSLTRTADTEALLDARMTDRASRGGDARTGSDNADDAAATDAIPSGATADGVLDEAKSQARTTAQEVARVQAAAVAQQAAAKQAAAAAQRAAAAKAAQEKAKARAWVPPISGGYTLTSGFGMRWGSMHPGQDFAIPVGTPVKAMSNGTVIFAGWSGGYGNKLEIRYWDGTVSWYAHNSRLLVSEGDTVTAGETVSLSGNTGHSTGPHLHVEIHLDGDAASSPIPWLRAKGIMP